jgi:hypothetical protein
MGQVLADWLRPAAIQQAVYTPGDLERISGLGADKQRVWRRRGQLPSHGSGHARFTIAEVVEITLRVALSKAGIGPGESVPDLSEAASAAMHHAIFCHGAVEVIGPAVEVEDFLRVFDEDQEGLGSFLIGYPQRSAYLVVNDRRETRIVDEPGEIVGGGEELNLVFDLALIGARLVERGRKPVVIVHFPDRPAERTIRRLTGLRQDQ